MDILKNFALLSLLSLILAVPVAVLADSDNSACLNDRVPTTTIVYVQDQQLSGLPAQLPMDAARDTLAYRTAAYDYFEQNYGLIFDPAIPGPQGSSDGTAIVQSFKLPDDVRYQVLAFDHQPIKKLRHRMPATNYDMLDDGYAVGFLGSTTVHGDWGGSAGKDVDENNVVVFGQYRMTNINTGNLFDTITYRSDDPVSIDSFGHLAFSCLLSSARFGDGVVLGHQRLTSDLVLQTRSFATFPATFTEIDPNDPKKCKNIPDVDPDDYDDGDNTFDGDDDDDDDDDDE